MSERLTIRLETLDGTWETLGVDRYRGIVAENIVYGSNEWGPDTCSFVLRRQAGGVYPDLSAYTPCKVEGLGEVVWSGRVWQTPTQDGGEDLIQVTGRGWQYHLDDDVYERIYVHSGLTDWVDRRSYLTAPLGSGLLSAQATVEAGVGGLSLMFPNGVTVVSGDRAEVMFDAGPENLITRVVWNYSTSANNNVTPQAQVQARGMDDPAATGAIQFGGWTLLALTTVGAGPATTSGTLSTPKRYISFQLQWSGGGTATNDAWLRINSVLLVTKTAYESGNASILKASDVVSDALSAATTLLSPDRSGIKATSFSIPDFNVQGKQSPRSVAQAVNAYHDWRTKVDEQKRMVFEPQAAAASLEAGLWPGARFDDVSANDGENIFNRVVVEGTGPDGVPLTVSRYAGQQSNPSLLPVSSPSLANPTFDVDALNWTTVNSTLTRDTVTFDSAPAAGKMVINLAGGSAASGDISGVFLQGLTYVITVRMKASVAMSGKVQLNDAVGTVASINTTLGTTQFDQFTLTFTPNRTVVPTILLNISVTASTGTWWFDSILIYRAVPTLVDRRGFVRTAVLPVQSSITTAEANQIGDVFQAGHKTTPLAGTLTVDAVGGVRKALGGEAVHPMELPMYTGELIRFTQLVDPDNGARGRKGRLASASYDGSSGVCTCQVDTDVGRQEALLARLALITGFALGT